MNFSMLANMLSISLAIPTERTAANNIELNENVLKHRNSHEVSHKDRAKLLVSLISHRLAVFSVKRRYCQVMLER